MIGVVADDITGANDIGIMFAKNGYRTIVTTLDAMNQPVEADVLIINTDSRLTSPEEVYESTRLAARCLLNRGCSQFFGKVCSVFRGNVGSLFDAVLDEVGESFAPVVLGFPKNGRTTLGGIHYVRGVELKDSEFRFDPVHPTHESNLLTILQGQSRRRVALIPLTTLDGGPAAITDALHTLRSQSGYAVFDVRDQADLARIADVIHNERVICGSSAIAEVFPPRERDGADAPPWPTLSGAAGVLVVSGSLTPQTKSQVAFLRSEGLACFELNTLQAVQDEGAWRIEREALIDAIGRTLASGKDALLVASQDERLVSATVEAGRQKGMSRVETSAFVSCALAEMTEEISNRVTLSRVVVAGGETSGAVCKALGIRSVQVLQEIAPGLPLSVTVDAPHRAVVLKSGSFGDAGFLAQAIDVIEKWQTEGRIDMA